MAEEPREGVVIGGEIDVRLRPDAPTLFSNLCLVSTAATGEELILRFATRDPDNPTQADVAATVYVSPYHAKRLIAALQSQIANYENDFGEIETNIIKRLTPAGRERLGLNRVDSHE